MVFFQTIAKLHLLQNSQIYGLYSSHYLGRPALSWDAKLSITKAELDFILDIDMYLFCGKGVRVGFFCISKRYTKANSKHLTSYNPKKPMQYITYLNKNNLYGYAMSNSLPAGGFKWLNAVKFNLDKHEDDNLKGCNLEFDLEYPKELHELYNDCSLSPDK